MPLSSSFWVDENATAFVVHHGATDPSLAVAPQVPDSIYYALPKAAERVLGFSEVVYRMPSLLVMLAGLCVIGRIGRALIHPAAGWMVVFACLSATWLRLPSCRRTALWAWNLCCRSFPVVLNPVGKRGALG